DHQGGQGSKGGQRGQEGACWSQCRRRRCGGRAHGRRTASASYFRRAGGRDLQRVACAPGRGESPRATQAQASAGGAAQGCCSSGRGGRDRGSTATQSQFASPRTSARAQASAYQIQKATLVA